MMDVRGVDWLAVADRCADLVHVDLEGCPGAVAWRTAALNTRNAVTAAVLEGGDL